MVIRDYIGEVCEIRILGPTGGMQVGGVLEEIGDGLVGCGDAVLLGTTPVVETKDGTLKVDWFSQQESLPFKKEQNDEDRDNRPGETW